jgi:hypothetical protein
VASVCGTTGTAFDAGLISTRIGRIRSVLCLWRHAGTDA